MIASPAVFAARALFIAMLFAAPLTAAAQQVESPEADVSETQNLRDRFQKPPEGVTYEEGYVEEIIEVEKPESRSTPRASAVIRALDKISGRVTDLEIGVGESARYGRLTLAVDACRAPPPDEPQDAFVFLRVRDAKLGGAEVFSGWIFASSPALSAMDHQRYDVWALRCSEAG